MIHTHTGARGGENVVVKGGAEAQRERNASAVALSLAEELGCSSRGLSLDSLAAMSRPAPDTEQ